MQWRRPTSPLPSAPASHPVRSSDLPVCGLEWVQEERDPLKADPQPGLPSPTPAGFSTTPSWPSSPKDCRAAPTILPTEQQELSPTRPASAPVGPRTQVECSPAGQESHKGHRASRASQSTPLTRGSEPLPGACGARATSTVRRRHFRVTISAFCDLGSSS